MAEPATFLTWRRTLSSTRRSQRCVSSAKRGQFGGVLHILSADVGDPGVEQAEVVVGHAVFHATALVVAADDDVLYLEVIDSVLEDAERVHIRLRHQIADVAVNEEFAGLAAGEVFGGDTRVGAADPEEFRLLALSKLLKIVVTLGELTLDPTSVCLK